MVGFRFSDFVLSSATDQLEFIYVYMAAWIRTRNLMDNKHVITNQPPTLLFNLKGFTL